MEQSNTRLADVRVIRWSQVHELTGKTRNWVITAIKRGVFPVPVMLGPRTYRWREREVLDWLASRPDQPNLRETPKPSKKTALDYWL